MEYIIGIDAGGSKSELIAYDLDFNELYRCEGSYGNPSINVVTAISNMIDIINKCMEDLKGNCKFIALGIAGIETGNYLEIVKKTIEEKFDIPTAILNDAQMACKAYLGNNNGLVVIAGTGSSVYMQKNNKGELIGGWGHLLGDEGSGYHTVIEAFKIITREIDLNLDPCCLSKEILEFINATNSSHIKQFIYNNDKKAIASLFPIITNLAKQQDENAINLLLTCSDNLSDLAIAALKRFDSNSDIIIGIKGGVFFSNDIVFSNFEKKLISFNNNLKFIKKNIDVPKAVCNLYNQGGM